MRGLSVRGAPPRRGARILACRVAIRGDIASTQYVEHREQAQRSNGGPIAYGGPIAHFGRQYLHHEIRIKRGRKCESQNRSRDREGAVSR